LTRLDDYFMIPNMREGDDKNIHCCLGIVSVTRWNTTSFDTASRWAKDAELGADYRSSPRDPPSLSHRQQKQNQDPSQTNQAHLRKILHPNLGLPCFPPVFSSSSSIMSSGTNSRAFYPSDRFVISCGTVPLDLIHKKVLLVRLRSTNEFLLPKGRKDENECLKAAAARETYEETGYPATILPLNVPTRATNRAGDGEHTEPIAITSRVTDGVMKIIFWYAASVDSQSLPEQDTQQEGEDFESVWMDCEQALAVLTFADDREVAQLAIHAAFGVNSSTPHSLHSL